MDAASRERPVLRPLADRDVDVADDPFGIAALDGSISHDDSQWFSAVETRRVDLDGSARKDPAEREGLESALPEPARAAVDADPVLSRQIIERGTRSDQVCAGVEPYRQPRVRQVVEELLAFLRRGPELLGDLGVVRRIPSRHERLEDEVVRPVQLSRRRHVFSSDVRGPRIAAPLREGHGAGSPGWGVNALRPMTDPLRSGEVPRLDLL